MVRIRSRGHSELKSKPAVWQPILGRELITLCSSADPHKNPTKPLPAWPTCLPWRPNQHDAERAWIAQGPIDASGNGSDPTNSQCPQPTAAAGLHLQVPPLPRQPRNSTILNSPPGSNTPPSLAYGIAFSWSTTAGPCWSCLTAPAAGRCISPAA